jgi:hypothetical protein
MLALSLPPFGYAFLQIGIAVTFGIAAMRAWRHSRARFVELITAFLFGLLLEQGDIFLFGTYRYDPHWVLLGDVPVAIALTWAMIIAGALNMTDALGIRDVSSVPRAGFWTWLARGLPAPMADAVWAILLDLALDAVAIRLGLWTWTIRADEGWFGVPWGNFFAWLFVAFWFSFFTRLVRARNGAGFQNPSRFAQWFVPFLAFGGLILTLVPFVAIENTAALPFVPDDASSYNNAVWVIFAATFVLFVGATLWGMFRAVCIARESVDHWLLFVRLSIHVLFLLALLGAGIVWDAPLLFAVAAGMLGIELLLTRRWLGEFLQLARARVSARGLERAQE